MTEKDLDKLEALAIRASPGPWHNFKGVRVLKAEKALTPKYHVPKEWNIASFPHRTSDYPISHEEYEANQDLIASADPSTLIELIRLARIGLKAVGE